MARPHLRIWSDRRHCWINIAANARGRAAVEQVLADVERNHWGEKLSCDWLPEGWKKMVMVCALRKSGSPVQ
jgi:hypothetical protein